MGTGTVCIGSSDAASSAIKSTSDDIHDFLDGVYISLDYAYNVDFLLAVFATVQECSVVQ